MRGLVLDLRNNSGGYLSTAIDISDSLLSRGTIVSTRTRGNEIASEDVAQVDNTVDLHTPMVVLINGISASASEIVSGCLKDNHRALIVGTRSFGKGNVQTIQDIRPTQAKMKITIAYYYLPSGRRVHRNPLDKENEDYGVAADVDVELTGKQMTELETMQRDAGILHRNGGAKENQDWTIYDAEKVLESDPQLRMALLCLKSRLLAESLGITSSEAIVKSKAAQKTADAITR
jgi:C-terminal peptidase prc